MRPSDVDHNAVLIERFGEKSCVDDERGAVRRLRWSEHSSAKRMGDHDVVADFDGEQESLLTDRK
jgi:hypothetical protein